MRKPLLIVYIIFVLVSTGLAFCSFDGYSVLSNTTSHLGAQGSPNAWLMNLVFVMLGLASIFVTYRTKTLFYKVMGGVFGLSLCFTGVFPHEPLIAMIESNQLLDTLHSIFATLTGFSFSVLALGHAIIARSKQRLMGIKMSVIAFVIPMGMMNIPSLMGLFQRIMFLTAFGWLFFYMEVPYDKRLNRR